MVVNYDVILIFNFMTNFLVMSFFINCFKLCQNQILTVKRPYNTYFYFLKKLTKNSKFFRANI